VIIWAISPYVRSVRTMFAIVRVAINNPQSVSTIRAHVLW
jgi:hypothetical protein